jgi:riboflavin synthase
VFTGIVEELGLVEIAGKRLEIGCQKVLSNMSLGSSIAVNGVCLTAVEIREDGFSADLAQETLDRSNLGDLKAGDTVNLERPLSLEMRLSGHLVQGHVDGTSVVESISPTELIVRVPEELDRLLVYKGSICIDGISLTIASVKDGRVQVAIIPHTYEVTTLSRRKRGDRLNIECDMIAKHVEKLLSKTTVHGD